MSYIREKYRQKGNKRETAQVIIQSSKLGSGKNKTNITHQKLKFIQS